MPTVTPAIVDEKDNRVLETCDTEDEADELARFAKRYTDRPAAVIVHPLFIAPPSIPALHDDAIRTIAVKFDRSPDATRRWQFKDVVPFVRACFEEAGKLEFK